MRKVLFLFIAVMFLFVSCDSGNKYNITGNIKGLKEAKVYLEKISGRENIKVDSTSLVDGKFSFTGSVSSPEMYNISVEGQRVGIKFFLENSNIEINADLQNPMNAEVVGSANQDVFVAYNEAQEESGAEFKVLRDAYKSATAKKDEAAMDSIAKVWDQKSSVVLKKNLDFVSAHSSSVAAAYIALRLSYKMDVDAMQSMYDEFAPDAKQSSFAQKIKDKIEILKNCAVGKSAPEISLNTPEGELFSLSSLKGKVVVIDFWASWCGPCRRENPHMVEIYKQYNDKGVEFLGVSLDKNKENWLKAIESDGLVWKHVSDLKYWDSAAAKLYGVSSIPSTVVVDENGIIVAKKVFGEELKAEIEKLLN